MTDLSVTPLGIVFGIFIGFFAGFCYSKRKTLAPSSAKKEKLSDDEASDYDASGTSGDEDDDDVG